MCEHEFPREDRHDFEAELRAVLGSDLAQAEIDADPKFWELVDAPAGLVEHVRHVARRDWIARKLMVQVERKFMRRGRTNSAEVRHARWMKRWRSGEQEKTKQAIHRQLGRVLRAEHRLQVAGHEPYGSLPPGMVPWRPDKRGRLLVTDPKRLKPSIGSPAFLEQTGIKVLRFLHETWLRRRWTADDEALDLDDAVMPGVWDLTAGSGTSIDYFRHLQGCCVIATDLTDTLGSGITEADCREVGSLREHHQRRRANNFLGGPEEAVRTPDIILFDPPSRGWPTHYDLYTDEAHQRKAQRSKDLATFSRDDYIETVAEVVVRAAQHLAGGGVLSFVVRCGERDRGRVVEDPELLVAIKEALSGRVAITDERAIAYGRRTNQAGLGTSRVPAVHLLIERAG